MADVSRRPIDGDVPRREGADLHLRRRGRGRAGCASARAALRRFEARPCQDPAAAGRGSRLDSRARAVRVGRAERRGCLLSTPTARARDRRRRFLPRASRRARDLRRSRVAGSIRIRASSGSGSPGPPRKSLHVGSRVSTWRRREPGLPQATSVERLVARVDHDHASPRCRPARRGRADAGLRRTSSSIPMRACSSTPA